MKTIYKGDDRYEKIKEQMDLLSITDVTTERQVLNGTIVWQLPIQSRYGGGKYLQDGAFASGYVRNQGVECHSNWQINKRYMGEYEYYPDYMWCEKTQQSIKTGKFNRFQSKKCVPIPIEIDMLEDMMNDIIKNEFVKRANSIVKGGEYLPKWQFDQASKYCDLSEERYKDLENKLATIKRISTYE